MSSDQCACKFVGKGLAMDTSECKVHENRKYPCDSCKSTFGPICKDYRPISEPRYDSEEDGRVWPRCICGHIAQEHN